MSNPIVTAEDKIPPIAVVHKGQKSPPPNYVMIREGSSPEPFYANNDEEAMSRLQKIVREGTIKIVYCYKLLCAERALASSETLTPEMLSASSAVDDQG